jgi:hypothetical protein
MGLEDEIREDLKEGKSPFPGVPLREVFPVSRHDTETRLVTLELAREAHERAILKLARELEHLRPKSS